MLKIKLDDYFKRFKLYYIIVPLKFYQGENMRRKIIGMLVCTLLITIVAIPAIAINPYSKTNTQQISPDAEVPTWEVGDSWTYDTHIYVAASPNVTDDMVVDAFGELTFEVVDDTGDNYILEGTMKPLSGTVDIPGNTGFKATKFTAYNANLWMRKTDLAIVQYESTMKGILLLTFRSIPLPIPIQMQEYRMTGFKPAWNILPFPLFDGKTGDYLNSTLLSYWDTSMFWGLIPISKGISDHGWVGGASYNVKLDNITVEAGTYDVYNVSCIVDFGTDAHDWYFSNYAEEVGNIVKGDYNIDYANGNTYYLINLELISTTYTP